MMVIKLLTNHKRFRAFSRSGCIARPKITINIETTVLSRDVIVPSVRKLRKLSENLRIPINWLTSEIKPIIQIKAMGTCKRCLNGFCFISLDQTEKPNPVYLNLPSAKPEVDSISLDHEFFDLVSSNEDRMEVLAI